MLAAVWKVDCLTLRVFHLVHSSDLLSLSLFSVMIPLHSLHYRQNDLLEMYYVTVRMIYLKYTRLLSE